MGTALVLAEGDAAAAVSSKTHRIRAELTEPVSTMPISSMKFFFALRAIFRDFSQFLECRRGQVAIFDRPYLSPHPTPYNSKTGYGLSSPRAFQRCTARKIS